MELVSSWELAGSYLAVQEAGSRSGADAVRAGLSGRATQLPWALRARGERLLLAVGPLDWQPGTLEPALELYHYWHQSLAFGLPPASIAATRSGCRLKAPGGPPDRAELQRLGEVLAPLVAPLLASLQMPPLRLEIDQDALLATFERAPLPGLYDAAAPLIGVALRHAALGATDLVRRRDLVRLESHFVEIVAQRNVASSGEAAPLWRRAEPDLERFVPRGHLDAARHALEVAVALEPPAPPTQRAETAVAAAAPAPAKATTAGLLGIVPFRAGARPIDEVLEKGTGASEAIGFLRSGFVAPGEEDNGIWILFRIAALEARAAAERLEVRLSARFLPPDTEPGRPVPIPGLNEIIVPAQVVTAGPNFEPALAASEYRAGSGDAYVASIAPQTQLLPARGPDSAGYRWEDLDTELLERCPDGRDPFTFAAFFHQRIAVTLALYGDGTLLDEATTAVEVFDTQRFGSLYERLLTLVADDTARQSKLLGSSDLYAAHHPFYPVLAIGMNKAAFYVKAIHQDLARQSKHLANPRWLLRVGLYLEYLTCIGIFEAVKDDFPDLLSPVERKFYQEAPVFRELRQRLAIDRWKDVWQLHSIVGKGNHPVIAGPVAFTNLLRKKQATLAFLHAHHADLQHAIELAGPNLESSQEAWHRVYRDAERAVVNTSLAAFPELQHIPPRYRDFCLWHVQGSFDELAGVAAGVLPRWLTDAFGDQDGVYPSGARQYRASMNHVAAWARDAGLMEFAGKECIPRSVSLIEALLDADDERFTALQARDGYAGALEAVSQTLALRPGVSRDMVCGFLRGLEIFSALDDAEIEELATRVKRIATVPTQDIVVEGQAGSSLYIVETGNLEVVRHTPRGELRVGRLRAGSVFGELALLTGELRSATVRSLDYAVLLEISKPALQPIVERRPRIIDVLSELLASRSQAASGTAGVSRAGLTNRINAFLFGGDHARPVLRTRKPEELVRLLETVKILRPLSRTELQRLAERVSITTHAADAAIVTQGDKGGSVFVVETGQVEVSVRRDGTEMPVARLSRGDVFGEMALFTGERRSATVRAAEGPATVIEISKSDILPLIAQRPPIILEISELLAARQAENRSLAKQDGPSLARRMQSFFLGQSV